MGNIIGDKTACPVEVLRELANQIEAGEIECGEGFVVMAMGAAGVSLGHSQLSLLEVVGVVELAKNMLIASFVEEEEANIQDFTPYPPGVTH